jgi:hypothetical protein
MPGERKLMMPPVIDGCSYVSATKMVSFMVLTCPEMSVPGEVRYQNGCFLHRKQPFLFSE